MRRAAAFLLVLIAPLIGAAGVVQARLDGRRPVGALESGELYVRSATFLDRAALSYDALVADVYWMRVIQHYGGQRRAEMGERRYDLLYPLLDLTTSLDPYFTAAYYFGSFFLAEPFPGGAGRPDLAVTLLARAMEFQPTAWRLAQQAGFIHYWYRRDYQAAAEWFRRAASLPDAPAWVVALEATTRAEGGDLEASRRLWQQMIDTAESDWMRETAVFRLLQVEAYTAIDALEQIVTTFALGHGRPPSTWEDLVHSGLVRGVPLDPAGTPFVIEEWGNVTVSPSSRLYPLPERPAPSEP
ncbi:MAG: tetratricopeptide repeat protein [Vicinamibacterales bacterium]